jgi:hypothetical protein
MKYQIILTLFLFSNVFPNILDKDVYAYTKDINLLINDNGKDFQVTLIMKNSIVKLDPVDSYNEKFQNSLCDKNEDKFLVDIVDIGGDCTVGFLKVLETTFEQKYQDIDINFEFCCKERQQVYFEILN